VTYALDGNFQRFESLVGLNEPAGKKGAVRIQVLVDGRAQLGDSQTELTPATGAVPIRMSVAKARELTLVVEFGRHADVGDHVDWADARLIKP
jgi:hypothetical protein